MPIPRRIQRLRVGISSVVGARRRLIDRRRTVSAVQFSKSAEEAVARVSHDGLSKLNSMQPAATAPPLAMEMPVGLWCRPSPVDIPGRSGVARPVIPRETKSRERRQARFRTGSHEGSFPRKEVIQPQLPLRLPCYDFTPVTSPTFDGSLPQGLGHRLRVLLTPVV